MEQRQDLEVLGEQDAGFRHLAHQKTDGLVYVKETMMSMDIRFTLSPSEGSTNKDEKYFSGWRYMPLADWLAENVFPFGCIEDCEICLQHEHMEKLKRELDNFSPDSCRKVFLSFGLPEELEKDFQEATHELKTWVSEIVETFDFETRTLSVHVWF